KKWKAVPDAPLARLVQLKKIYISDVLISKILNMYEMFRDIERLDKVRENEFRKGVNLKVFYKGNEVNVNLLTLSEYAELLERFISILK
ncbi:MAG: hypothetical protein AAB546_03665, partial [Patescibacteria group bacterium]